MRLEIERLIKQAERDAENARKNIGIDAFEVAAFLAEQAVEKYLKAYWMLVKKEGPPFTHSLTELGDALGVPKELRRHLVSLTADYTTSRYPDAANGINPQHNARIESLPARRFIRSPLFESNTVA